MRSSDLSVKHRHDDRLTKGDVRLSIRDQIVVHREPHPGNDAVLVSGVGQHEVAVAGELPAVVSKQHAGGPGKIECAGRVGPIDVSRQRGVAERFKMVANRDRVAAEIDHGG